MDMLGDVKGLEPDQLPTGDLKAKAQKKSIITFSLNVGLYTNIFTTYSYFLKKILKLIHTTIHYKITYTYIQGVLFKTIHRNV